MKIFLCLILFNSYSLLAKKTMFFNVRSFKMDRKNGPLKGVVNAESIRLDLNGDVFEVLGTRYPFKAQASLSSNGQKLEFQNGRLRFKAPLGKDNFLQSLNYVALDTAIVQISDKSILMKGEGLEFERSNEVVRLEKADIFCPTKGRFSTAIDTICLTQSESKIGRGEFRRNGVDLRAEKVRTSIHSKQFSINSSHLSFISGEAMTEVIEFYADCENTIGVDHEHFDRYQLLKGCLSKGSLKAKRFRVDDEKEEALKNKGIIDIDDLKEVRILLDKGVFLFTSKLKAVFRVKVKIEGRAELFPEKEELHLSIEKARVGGVSAKGLALRLIKRFVLSDSIRIEEDRVILKI